jgi:hypothetical protein
VSVGTPALPPGSSLHTPPEELLCTRHIGFAAKQTSDQVARGVVRPEKIHHYENRPGESPRAVVAGCGLMHWKAALETAVDQLQALTRGPAGIWV